MILAIITGVWMMSGSAGDVGLRRGANQTNPSRSTEPAVYQFADAAIRSLSVASAAKEMLGQTEQAEDHLAALLRDMIDTRRAISRLREGALLLSPFLATSDGKMKDAAKALSDVYGGLGDRLNAGLVVYEQMAKVKDQDGLAALLPETSKLAADVDEAWRLIPVAVAGVAHVLVDQDRTIYGKVGYLRISRKERAELLQTIKTLFPGLKEGEGHAVDVSASLFRQFLLGGWKGSDEP